MLVVFFGNATETRSWVFIVEPGLDLVRDQKMVDG
jgi:hypothetical protein